MNYELNFSKYERSLNTSLTFLSGIFISRNTGLGVYCSRPAMPHYEEAVSVTTKTG